MKRFLSVALLGFVFSGFLSAVAQDDAPQAHTTSDSEIETSHLDLFLDPLTKDQLLVEATAWQGLLQANAVEIAKLEVATRQKKSELAEANKEKQAAVKEASKQGEAAVAEIAEEQIEEAKEHITEAKEDAQARLEDLRTKNIALIDRLNMVLAAYEAKGGDATEFHLYVSAVSGIKADISDASATFSALKGWITSKEGGVKLLIKTGTFLGIMILFCIVATIVGNIVRKATELNVGMSDLLKQFINKTVRRTVMAIGLLVALGTIGVNVGAILALVGGSAFVIGFALQDTLGNFAAGLMLLMYRPFDVGDVVDVGGTTGKVDQVSLVNTTIRTFDNKIILVPNQSVWGQTIVNATASSTRRVDLVFGISYDDDYDKAREILEGIIEKHEKILKDPEPVVRLHELADSSVNFVCRPWTKTEDYWDVYWDLTRAAKKEFDAAGISIPYPQQDVYMHQVNS